MSIKSIAIGITSGGDFSAGVVVKNSGQSPAMHVHLVCEVRFSWPSQEPEGFVSDYYYTKPWPLGDIRTGDHAECGPVTFHDIKVPSDRIGDGPESHAVILAKVGVFGKDVFKEEISCLETAITLCKPGDVIRFDDDWTQTPLAIYPMLDDSAIKAHAWAGEYYAARKPKRRAESD